MDYRCGMVRVLLAHSQRKRKIKGSIIRTVRTTKNNEDPQSTNLSGNIRHPNDISLFQEKLSSTENHFSLENRRWRDVR